MGRRVTVKLHPLAQGSPPPWAASWGQDRFGPYAVLEVGEARQRFRWIPPGEYLRGSPEHEVGRSDHEGPQHEVVLTRGFWLADTPVTQALWQAVMSRNPSRFVDSTRPVEQVSWEETQAFCSTLQEQFPSLQPRLPTEAEWEYACRAGTTGATWAGELDLVGIYNAPVLDAIAWYGGNSGWWEWDLEGEGIDSARWPEKHHAHTEAGTRRVATKQPNPWGLYDMLGNVLEWCEDGTEWPPTYGSERLRGPTFARPEAGDPWWELVLPRLGSCVRRAATRYGPGNR